ncbi:hypothetical protein [Nocardia neocaledoniensis]|uniref:hypothetical protein n=1 Tax=Nocardia neocaledoniensis TaxID=236511 RepID=UPI002455C414|nr:hypothetical protein [Nocardia neocaledoniensis]
MTGLIPTELRAARLGVGVGTLAEVGGDLILLIVTVGPVALLGWAAIRAKKRGLGGAFVGPFQEMFDPGAARAQIVMEERAELPDPADSGDPDDEDGVPNTVVYKGVRLHIDPARARRRQAGPDGDSLSS